MDTNGSTGYDGERVETYSRRRVDWFAQMGNEGEEGVGADSGGYGG